MVASRVSIRHHLSRKKSPRPRHHDNGHPRSKLKTAPGRNSKPLSTPATAHPAPPPRIRTPHGLRIAAIDIGTNSLHMVIVEVTDNLTFKTLSSDKDLTNLGASALVRHRLTQRAIDHTIDVLARYQKIAQGLDCDVVLVYATSAVRESVNGGDFVLTAKSRLKLPVQVISANEEAHLIYLAVRNAVDLSTHAQGPGPSLIVDIGGGSVEFIVGTNQKPLLLESFKLGASRLTQQFIQSDPPSKKELDALEKHIRKTLKPTLQQIRDLKPLRVIGTSGTMENIAAMCALQHGEEIHRHRLLTHITAADFDLVYKRLVRLPLDDRRRIPGLDPGRADQIAAGATVVRHLFDKLDIPYIDVCDRAMREGMIIDYMQTHWPKVKLSVQIRDPRRRSVFELGRRCNFDEKHALHVAKLSLQLFDGLASIHHLSAPGREAAPSRYRELLEYAAILHDIGWHIGHSGHHKHSAYLIKNGDLENFSQNELDLIANIARYHRKSPPKKSHPDYVALDSTNKRVVWILAGILRIADGLDRGHYGNVSHLKTIARRQSVSIRVFTQTDPELELWAARHKFDMFEQSFARTVKFSTARANMLRKPNRLGERQKS
jgi:exopolyphosphatase/guanosine-5'-triphosphate,3'-diphosphate pyrophosphatase